MKLNLGVIDEAYSAGAGATTTLQVARMLESNYHVMKTFSELHRDAIDSALKRAFSGIVQDMLDGRSVPAKVDVPAIKAAFTNYLDSGEWEKVSGQYIKAAHNRHQVHHNDGSKEQSRRSNKAFVRTGQYEQSFNAWIEGAK